MTKVAPRLVVVQLSTFAVAGPLACSGSSTGSAGWFGRHDPYRW